VTSAAEATIRPATEADAELLFGLILELAEYEKLADAVRGDPQVLFETAFIEKLAWVLATDTNAIVGPAIKFD